MPYRYIEIGKSGVKWSQGGYVQDEFLPELRGRSGIKMYREMSDNDSIIGACLFAIDQILREIRWTATGYDKSSISQKRVTFLRRNMNEMHHSWNDSIMDVLSMLRYGWAYHEIVYERKRSGEVWWRKIVLRKQESFDHWELDNNGTVLGLWQNPAPDYQFIFIPIFKSLLFRPQIASDNPEGRSILRNCYRSWYFKKNIEEIEAIAVERDLTGLPTITMPEGFDFDSEEQKVIEALTYAKKLVTNIRRDSQDGVLLPFGWELKLMSSPGQKQFNTSDIINRYDKSIASSVLAEFILLGMERTGSYALSKDLTDMFFLCLEGWANTIASVFNRFAVPKLFAFNGIKDQFLPRIVPSVVHRYNIKDLSEFISRLAGINALVIDEELQKYLKRVARLSEFKEVD